MAAYTVNQTPSQDNGSLGNTKLLGKYMSGQLFETSAVSSCKTDHNFELSRH